MERFADLAGTPKDRLMALAALNTAFRDVLRAELQAVLDKLLRTDAPEAFTDKQVVAALGNKATPGAGLCDCQPRNGPSGRNRRESSPPDFAEQHVSPSGQGRGRRRTAAQVPQHDDP